MTRWHLRASSSSRRIRCQKAGKPAPLCDMVTPEFSLSTLVLEYLSFLASSEAPRLTLLWGRNYTSFFAWAEDNPVLAAAFRRGCAVAASWIHLRSYARFLCLPWTWARMADSRLNPGTKLRSAYHGLHAPQEQVDEGFTLPLRRYVEEEGLGSGDMMNGILIRFFWL